MSYFRTLIPTMFCTLLLMTPAIQGVAQQGDVSDMNVLQLAATVRDPVSQRSQTMLVRQAISALGENGGPLATEALVECIGWPWVVSPLPEDRLQARNGPGGIISSHILMNGGFSSDAFPAVKALMKIGEPCIPLVLAKLGVANTREKNACLDLLVELSDRDVVQAMLQNEISTASSPETRQNLQDALARLPDIQRQSVVHTSPRSAAESKNLQAAPQLQAAAIGIVVDGKPTSGAAVMADGVALVPASEVARLLRIGVTSDGDSRVFFGPGTRTRLLSFTANSKMAVADKKTLALCAVPKMRGGDLLVPLNVVVGFFGGTLKWDPAKRVAYVWSTGKRQPALH